MKFILLLFLACIITACEQNNYFLGYVEGELTYISSPFSGKLNQLFVQRGQHIKAGASLFQLEQQPEVSELKSALASVAQMAAELADKSTGDRPSELAAIEAQISQAQAQLEYARKDLERKQTLVNQNAVEKNQLDVASQNFKVAQATVRQLQEDLTTANLAGRTEQLKSLQAQLSQANANLEKAQWTLQQKSVAAPVDAQVFDTYYRVGEQVPANQAVLSLLAPADIKIVFFVNESALSQIKTGQTVHVHCDHCAKNLKANIKFISPSAEYTPPIIYSRSARSKLVYEVEAVLDDTHSKKKDFGLNPGEPVEVTIK